MAAQSSTPLRDALADFYTGHALPPDGGVNDRWVRIRIVGPVSIFFPNFESRKKSVLLHDLHHIATGYGTKLFQEAEIGAWEIGGGCADHPAAWVLNGGALLYGVPCVPRRVFRAFMRGRHTSNLYHAPFDPMLLNGTVGELRHRLLLDKPTRHPSRADIVCFAVWATGIVIADCAAAFAAIACAWWVVSIATR